MQSASRSGLFRGFQEPPVTLLSIFWHYCNMRRNLQEPIIAMLLGIAISYYTLNEPLKQMAEDAKRKQGDTKSAGDRQ